MQLHKYDSIETIILYIYYYQFIIKVFLITMKTCLKNKLKIIKRKKLIITASYLLEYKVQNQRSENFSTSRCCEVNFYLVFERSSFLFFFLNFSKLHFLALNFFFFFLYFKIIFMIFFIFYYYKLLNTKFIKS